MSDGPDALTEIARIPCIALYFVSQLICKVPVVHGNYQDENRS